MKDLLTALPKEILVELLGTTIVHISRMTSMPPKVVLGSLLGAVGLVKVLEMNSLAQVEAARKALKERPGCTLEEAFAIATEAASKVAAEEAIAKASGK